MKTLIKEIDINKPDQDLISLFATMLADGKTVIFPTETVYGLGANALDEDAATKIYQAKGRPSDNPLLVHVADKEDVYDLVENIDDRAKLLMDKFWPGPLTIVFKKKAIIPDRTSGGLDTVAIRMPSDQVARDLIRQAGVPIAAPSANISGRPSPTKPEHIIRDMDGRVDGILVGGPCDYGVESTIIDLSEDLAMVLRPGSITLEMLGEVLGRVDLDPSLKNKDDNIRAKAPGMKYKHYSPQAQVYIVKADDLEGFAERVDSLCEDNAKKGLKIGVMTMNYDQHSYQAKVFDLGGSDTEVAKNLFDSLISLDREYIDIAYVPYFEERGIGVAIMNRLKKAAAYRII
ncbi:MAG: threonylcarbamoyl-AMP synthase [Peptostreptococcus sp.]|jgi:sua5/yciO/yrdC/ywlC family protein|uniref:L-threonylcarbamoyladenylate synthase n=1 Tax=Peptostreptococcus sp. TaxID=1262 RepID=UPI001CAB43CD|nr:L-threonylcarbamoyladenylate synthase [Peptostreptococcus sp.]MBF1043944.1 threonylcarbamoyl-AMP synthase [Peptostreptococcus sp.]